ncbi:MAG TPA: hypothetical protein VEH31_14700 [Streptosporangiaceae bacterium]|nr:hypothetical protein [Streptosporangiaceae bacterium]
MLLAHGGVSRGTTYELRVTADGAEQTLAIDGVNVARVPELSSGSTAYVLLEALNLGTHTASAAFSHFAFAPLR